jgi:uncharacterized SAM-binding protein YcdF (DUF218 family)
MTPVIILFGAGVRPDGTPTLTLTRRIDAARRFGESLPDPPLYMPTGGIGRHGPSEASVMRAALLSAGVPDERILVEETARDTLDSIYACRRLLRGLGHQGPVFAATSAYHLPRCVILLRLAGIKARPVPPPPEPAAHSVLRRWHWRLRELPALPWDVLLLLIDRLLPKR